MILIGQFDSSYVRRVAIALRLYGLDFEHRPWSVFSDAERLRAINPLMRVPVLILDDGEALVDSASIIDHLDSLVSPDRRLFPVTEPARRRALKIAALATGLADKGVSLFYERRLHAPVAADWDARLVSQILSALAALNADRAPRDAAFWFGDVIGHADIAVACAFRHVREAHPGLIDDEAFPAVADHCRRMEGLPVFQEIQQPFVAPA